MVIMSPLTTETVTLVAPLVDVDTATPFFLIDRELPLSESSL